MSQMIVKIGGDAAGFRKALNDTRNTAKSAGAGIASSLGGGLKNLAAPIAGMLSAGALTALTKQIINFADELDDNAKKLGITTEAYQQLDYMAKVSGADMGNVSMAVKTLSGDLTDAANGNKEAADKFGVLGLAIQDLKGLSPDKLFETVAKKIAAIQDPTERTARAVDMFGRAGMQLSGMMQDFDALKKQASETASILDSETIAAAAKFNDTMTALFTNIAAGVGKSPLIKWLAQAAEGFNELMNAQEKYEKKKQEANATGGGHAFGSAFDEMTKNTTIGLVMDAMEWGLDKMNPKWREQSPANIRMDLKPEEKQKQLENELLKTAYEWNGEKMPTAPERKKAEAAAKAAREADIKRETAARKIMEAQEKLETAGRKETTEIEKKIRLDAMRAAGMDKQASLLEKELSLREKLNRPLTQDEYANIDRLATAEQTVADFKNAQKNMDFGKPEEEGAIGLERIGAVYRGSFDSGRDRILNMQVDQLKKANESIRDIISKMTAEELR